MDGRRASFIPFASIHPIPILFAVVPLVYFYTSSLVPLNVVIQFILLCVAVVVRVVAASSVNKPENLYHLSFSGAAVFPCLSGPFKFFVFIMITTVCPSQALLTLVVAAAAAVAVVAASASIRLEPRRFETMYVYCSTVHTFTLSLKFIKLYRIMCAHGTKRGTRRKGKRRRTEHSADTETENGSRSAATSFSLLLLFSAAHLGICE